MDGNSTDGTDHTKQGLGHYGETLAARHLTGAGMVLLERNWRTTAGEIDLLLREGDVLVVCEVKTRTSDACGLPHEAVDQAKVDRLRRVADEWLAAMPPTLATSGSTWWRSPGRSRVLGRGARAGDRLMSVATAYATWLQGAMGHLIEVQADVSSGVVGTTVVGRADVAINEARERCRMAIVNSGLAWPGSKRITILLSPADLAKRGTHFDLAIAVAVLAAHDRVKSERLPQSLFVGELTLTGGLRCVHGVLPMVLSAARHGIRQVFVPEPQVREAALVPGVVVFGLRSLAQVAALLNDEAVPEAPPVAGLSSGSLLSWRGQSRLDELDLLDVDGMAEAKYAVEVAAAGGHHVMLTGPKGAGKTTLAERLPSLLPDLTAEESLELTAIHSLAGVLGPADDLIVRPPFFAPHHDASKVGLLGGGSGRVRPGDVSRAHNGVLFLDEFPLFRADVIEALRQPLESGEVTITRGEESATFPARGLVVMACNPCPCGNFHPHPSRTRATASSRCGATTAPSSPGRSPTGSTSTARCSPSRRTSGTTASPRARPRRSCGPGSATRACASSSGTPTAAGGSTRRRPAPSCNGSGRSPPSSSRRSTTRSTPVGSRAAARRACTGSRGRSPTSTRWRCRVSPSSTPPCG